MAGSGVRRTSQDGRSCSGIMDRYVEYCGFDFGFAFTLRPSTCPAMSFLHILLTIGFPLRLVRAWAIIRKDVCLHVPPDFACAVELSVAPHPFTPQRSAVGRNASLLGDRCFDQRIILGHHARDQGICVPFHRQFVLNFRRQRLLSSVARNINMSPIRHERY